MQTGFWIALGIVVAVVIYAGVAVWRSVQKSRRQWQQVDRSKLREWKDDDEW